MTNIPEDSAPSVWSELRAQRDLLIEMKVKLERVEDHERRLRTLEERKFPLPTTAIVVACLALLSNVVTFLMVR